MVEILTYRSYAKVNLYLDVIGRRPDGFHDIETIFQTVSLADELTFSRQADEITLDCPAYIQGKDNLVYRAAILLREHTACKQGVHITLEKNIPVAAGLAGGSGNAAATLLALNNLWDLDVTNEKLANIGLELGSDVPYCLIGGTAAATGRGEIIDPMNPLPETWFILLHPDITVSTADVYNSDKLTFSEEETVYGRTPSFENALMKLNNGELSEVIFNRMEAPVFEEYPELSEAKQRLLDAGCKAAAMSGSGPTIFGICDIKKDAQRISDEFDDFSITLTRSNQTGVEQL